MTDEWDQDQNTYKGAETPGGGSGPSNQDDIDKRIEDIKRMVVQGASEAQLRLRKVVDKAGEYWQQAQVAPTAPPPAPKQAASVESSVFANWRICGVGRIGV